MRSGGNRYARLLPGRVGARLFLLIALAMVPMLLLLGWVYYQRYQTLRAQALQAELEVAQGAAATFRAYVDTIQRQNYSMGQAIITLERYTQAKATSLLTVTASQYPTMRNLSWVSPDGTVLASSLPTFVGRSLSVRPYFRQIMAGQSWTIGDLTPQGTVTTAPTFGIATGIRGEQGTLLGVIVAGMEPARLGELTLTQQRPEEGAYAIFDGQGVLVYRKPELPLTWEDRVRWRESDAVLRRALRTGQPQVGLNSLEIPGGDWISARVPIPETGWVAGAGRPAAVAFAPLERALFIDSLIAMIVFALAFLLAYYIARTIAGPLRRLQGDAEAMGAGDIRRRRDSVSPEEVRSLRGTVEEMAIGLVDRAEALRHSEVRFRQLADAMPQLVWTADPDGRVDYYNARRKEYEGITSSVDGSYEWAPVLHEDDLEATVRAWQHSLATGEVYQIEHRVRRADGTYRWHLSRGVPVRDEHGNIVKWYGTATDIHDLKSAEEREREREAEKTEFYRRTIMAATEGKLVITERDEICRAAGEPLAFWRLASPQELSVIRHEVEEIAHESGIEDSGAGEFIIAVGEATTNAFKHAAGGEASLHRNRDSLIFVVSDRGPGIPALSLPDVALTRGYSTAGTLGMGYKYMISFSDRVYLATGPEGTTVGLEISLRPKADLPFRLGKADITASRR